MQVGRNPLCLTDWLQKGVYIFDDLIEWEFSYPPNTFGRYHVNTNFLQLEGVFRAVKCFLDGRTFLKKHFAPEFYAFFYKSMIKPILL